MKYNGYWFDSDLTCQWPYLALPNGLMGARQVLFIYITFCQSSIHLIITCMGVILPAGVAADQGVNSDMPLNPNDNGRVNEWVIHQMGTPRDPWWGSQGSYAISKSVYPLKYIAYSIYNGRYTAITITYMWHAVICCDKNTFYWKIRTNIMCKLATCSLAIH